MKKITIAIMLTITPVCVFGQDSLGVQAPDTASAAEIALDRYNAFKVGLDMSYGVKSQLARALAHSGSWAKAVEVYSIILEEIPDDADALLGRGLVHAWQGEYALAQADLEYVTTNHPDYIDAWMALGNTHLWSGNAASAVTAYSSWIKIDSDNPKPYLSRAQAAMALRSFSSARKDLRRSQRRGGDSAVIDRLLRDLDREPASTPWEPRITFDRQSFTGSRDDWSTLTFDTKRELLEGSITGSYREFKRFGLVDRGAAIDYYRNLWALSYANIKWQWIANTHVLPKHDAAIEIYQGLSNDMEGSVSIRQMMFPGKTVNIYGVTLARYSGNWYYRGQSLIVPRPDGTNLFGSLSARRYIRTVDEYVEFTAGRGRDLVLGDEVFVIRDSQAFVLRGQSFIKGRYGLTLSVNLRKTDAFTQRGVIAGIISRW